MNASSESGDYHKIKDIEDIGGLSRLADDCRSMFSWIGPFWYRGQTESWPLRPKIFRKDAPTKKEGHLTNLFRLEAASRYDRCPSFDTREATFNWLALMRHYGLPTRLLDWTESILVAAHFALEGPDECDAVIWVLSPATLNLRFASQAESMMPVDGAIQDLADEGFEGQQDRKQHLAVIPASIDQRMMLQQSRFTIHGTSTALDELKDCGEFLSKCSIPIKRRADIRRALRALGISKRTLFPDLSALASDLTTEMMQMIEGS